MKLLQFLWAWLLMGTVILSLIISLSEAVPMKGEPPIDEATRMLAEEMRKTHQETTPKSQKTSKKSKEEILELKKEL